MSPTIQSRRLTLHGVQLDVYEQGQGRPILVLHGEDGPCPQVPFSALLVNQGWVILPTHPGFGHAPDVADIDTVDDLAYLYLDLLDEYDLQDAVVIGCSLRGWIAAEMAVKSTARLSRMILVSPLGIKVGDRETRDIPDIFALPPEEVVRLQYHDPTQATLDYTSLSDDELLVIARNREATALYAWEPYFHNPKLRQRLHRIAIPTLLVWGASDRFVTSGYYGTAYRDAIPNAQLAVIDRAGHWPHVEQPEAVVERVGAFLASA